MTPEEVNRHFSRVLNGRSVESLCALRDSALRLAAIEGAGDEEVGKILGEAMADFEGEREREVFEAAEKLADIAKSRNQVIADLRAKLGEAERFLKFAHESGAAFDTYNYESPEEKSVCEEWRKFLAESEVQGG